MGRLFDRLFDLIKIAALAFLIAFPINVFFIQPMVVRDDSMAPEYQQGDIILINKWHALREDSYSRNELVVFRDEANRKNKVLRAIAGLPFERIVINEGILSIAKDGEIFYTEQLPIFDTVVSSFHDIGDLDAHEYFVLANKWNTEHIGIVDSRFIIGVPYRKIWPLDDR